MQNQALYLKYRPGRFGDLTGQDPIVRTLTRALATNRVGHAYLFTGPRGTGKTTTARLLAKGLNCAHPKDGEPDNTCQTCQAITTGKYLDVLEIDAASNRGIDEIRDLRDKVQLVPSQGQYKVYIIDEVHMLTKEAFNALLKTLEEPPAHAIFILATTEPQKLLQTIISRCQRFDFKPATPAVIATHLAKIAKAEKIDLDQAAAELIAREARGSYRDGLSILDVLVSFKEGKITADLAREALGLADVTAVAEFERALAKEDSGAAFGVLNRANQQGIAAETFRLALLGYLRQLLLAKVDAVQSEEVSKRAADWSQERLAVAIRTYLEAGNMATTSTIPELPMELATLKLLSASQAPAPQPQASKETTLSQKPPAEAPAPKVAPSDAKTSLDKVSGPPVNEAAKKLWEDLLVATKEQYSLSVSLQRTRPLALTDDKFKLGVQSEFFLKKLNDRKTKAGLEELIAKQTSRPVTLELTLQAVEPDVFDDALKVFEGVEVE